MDWAKFPISVFKQVWFKPSAVRWILPTGTTHFLRAALGSVVPAPSRCPSGVRAVMDYGEGWRVTHRSQTRRLPGLHREVQWPLPGMAAHMAAWKDLISSRPWRQSCMSNTQADTDTDTNTYNTHNTHLPCQTHHITGSAELSTVQRAAKQTLPDKRCCTTFT